MNSNEAAHGPRAHDARTGACLGCGSPIARAWQPTDPSLVQYHAGCRPGAGRIPYVIPARPVVSDPFDAREQFEAQP